MWSWTDGPWRVKASGLWGSVPSSALTDMFSHGSFKQQRKGHRGRQGQDTENLKVPMRKGGQLYKSKPHGGMEQVLGQSHQGRGLASAVVYMGKNGAGALMSQLTFA